MHIQSSVPITGRHMHHDTPTISQSMVINHAYILHRYKIINKQSDTIVIMHHDTWYTSILTLCLLNSCQLYSLMPYAC